MLIALTVLPAMLGTLGGKAFAGRVRRPAATADGEGVVVNGGVHWARTLRRRPFVIGPLAVVALGALSVPAQDLQLALPTDSTASRAPPAEPPTSSATVGPGGTAPARR